MGIKKHDCDECFDTGLTPYKIGEEPEMDACSSCDHEIIKNATEEYVERMEKRRQPIN